MIALYFEGWFQCRLATNPDPADEPRGVSGYTFALPGEPDLDRVIRFSDPVAPRSHAPSIGVVVTEVGGGTREDVHALRGGRVELLGRPKFESRNLLLTDDRAGTGLIHPFHIQVSGESLRLAREDQLYPQDPSIPMMELPASILNRRAPVHLGGFTIDSTGVRKTAGIADPSAYRLARRRLLERDLESESDAAGRAAIERRISELRRDGPSEQRVFMLQTCQIRRFEINGPAEIVDPAGRLGSRIDPRAPWPIDLWMGAWDADGLCGFVSGRLSLPTVP